MFLEWFSVITPQTHCTIDVLNVVYAVVLCIDNLTFISNISIAHEKYSENSPSLCDT